ncbi:MAG: phage tail tape measure protein [Proteobacteria bacterium]|nr:phage tail tape measure protein [Pseudomonadota bacterium]
MTDFENLDLGDLEIKNPLNVAGLSASLVSSVDNIGELRSLAERLIKAQQKIHHPDRQTARDDARSRDLNNALSDLKEDDSSILESTREEYLQEYPFAKQLEKARFHSHSRDEIIRDISVEQVDYLCGLSLAQTPHPIGIDPCRILLADYAAIFEKIGRKGDSEEIRLAQRQLEKEVAQDARLRGFPDKATERRYLESEVVRKALDLRLDSPTQYFVEQLCTLPQFKELAQETLEGKRNHIPQDYPKEVVDFIMDRYERSPEKIVYDKAARSAALRAYRSDIQMEQFLASAAADTAGEEQTEHAGDVATAGLQRVESRWNALLPAHSRWLTIAKDGSLSIETKGRKTTLRDTTLIGAFYISGPPDFTQSEEGSARERLLEDIKRTVFSGRSWVGFDRAPSLDSFSLAHLEELIQRPTLEGRSRHFTYALDFIKDKKLEYTLLVGYHTPPEKEPYLSILGAVVDIKPL